MHIDGASPVMMNERMENLRAVGFLCALMVVSIHCWSPHLFVAGAASLSSLKAGMLILLTASLSRVAVPCFFVLTGFFLARRFCLGMSWYRTVIQKRFLTIYVPFMIWNAINVALAFAFGKAVDTSPSMIFQKIAGLNPYVGTACIQFWYLQTVIIWVLVSPVILPVLKRDVFAIPMAILLAVAWVLNYRCVPYAISPWAFLWLTVGTMAAFHENHTAVVAAKLRTSKIRAAGWAVLSLTVLFRIFAGLSRDAALFNLAEKVLVPIGVATLFLNSDVIAWMLVPFRRLWGLGFFVYAFHTIVISVIALVFSRVPGNEFCDAVCKLVGGVAVSLCVGFTLRKVQPKVFAVVTGGRG